MNTQKPIYTEKARCQDCYKCVRTCPVKAIRVENESAMVMAERCIYCGTCVATCPSGAKKVRDDMGRARLLMKRRERAYLSLAPSWVAEFKGLDPARMVAAVKRLGFKGVSETALGAQEVTAACAALLKVGTPSVHISTACPSVVDLVRRYRPEHAHLLTPLLSPMLAHAKLLHREFGEDIGIVFAGPCIAKKEEADHAPHLMDLAITFEGLRRWFDTLGIDPYAEVPGPDDHFVPRTAGEGSLYPMDGGMNTGIQRLTTGSDVRFMSFSGITNVQDALDGLDGVALRHPLFLELLACEGGCINGPRMTRHCGTALKRLDIEGHVETALAPCGRCIQDPGPRGLDIGEVYAAEPVAEARHSEKELQKGLRRVGKVLPEDELNCGGCGYETCRSLASALLEGRAEPGMCVSYMRKLAMNKANALMRSMPSGVVIVNEHLEIIECNRKFAEILGGETVEVYDAKPGMAGASLAKVAPPLPVLFRQVLDGDAEEVRKDLRSGDRILRLLLFPVEAGSIVGAILQDITEPAVQREQIIAKAQDVIRKNVTTVQQIAYLLGENAAETEMILNSIVDSFQLIPTPKQGKG